MTKVHTKKDYIQAYEAMTIVGMYQLQQNGMQFEVRNLNITVTGDRYNGHS